MLLFLPVFDFFSPFEVIICLSSGSTRSARNGFGPARQTSTLADKINACHPIEPFLMDACAQSGRRLSREIHFLCSLLAGKSGGVHPTTMPAINPTQIEKRESIKITKCLPSSPIMFSWAGQFASSVSTSHRVHQQGPLASSILPF